VPQLHFIAMLMCSAREDRHHPSAARPERATEQPE
jgi:hypothetical protein